MYTNVLWRKIRAQCDANQLLPGNYRYPVSTIFPLLMVFSTLDFYHEQSRNVSLLVWNPNLEQQLVEQWCYDFDCQSPWVCLNCWADMGWLYLISKLCKYVNINWYLGIVIGVTVSIPMSSFQFKKCNCKKSMYIVSYNVSRFFTSTFCNLSS